MKIKFLIYIIIIVIGISIIIFQFSSQDKSEKNDQFSDGIKKTKLDITSLFNIYGFEDQFEIKNGKKTWSIVKFELNSQHNEL